MSTDYRMKMVKLIAEIISFADRKDITYTISNQAKELGFKVDYAKNNTNIENEANTLDFYEKQFQNIKNESE